MPSRIERAVSDGRIPLDDVDGRILELLSADARMSARALAREIGMSPQAISDRVTRLEQVGVIKAYAVSIDYELLGFGLEAIIALQTEQGPPLADALDQLVAIPEVQAVHVVSGRWDLMLLVRACDHVHLRNVVMHGVWSVPGFRHSETMISMHKREPSHMFDTSLFTAQPRALTDDAERGRARAQ